MTASREPDSAIAGALASLERTGALARLWNKDHTLWSDSPTEITDRLGWLDVPLAMRDELDAITQFARRARDDGFTHVVVLGMGGSSLGAETLRRYFGDTPGWPQLIVLDSTIPAQVAAVAESVSPARTLFVVSSKSGDTIEPNVLYKFFAEQVRQSGTADPGQNFIAITDAGTPLDSLAARDGFRETFRNPPDIAGRYAVLSFFGLVPAALAGYDIAPLLSGAERMRAACAPDVSTHLNPAASFGAAISARAESGRDKLTLLTSPSLESFGLWAEQLVSESLGKDGKGIVPIAAEPLADPRAYAPDRHFIHLKRASERFPAADTAEALESAGRPVIRRRISDVSDLGAEFYLWEFAVAVAAAIMRVHPFNQPDVQRAKDLARQSLDIMESTGERPRPPLSGSIHELLSATNPGDYLAILAYLPQTPQTDDAFSALRARILHERGIPATLGYGPRYLHSTGQLHKGGKNNVAALMVTERRSLDLEIPGEPFTFGHLSDAQAAADLQALMDAGRRVASVDIESIQNP